MTSPKLLHQCLLSAMAFSLLLLTPAWAEPDVTFKVSIKGDTLVVETTGKTSEPAARMNPDPSFLELAFPDAKMASKAFSKTIDKGLVRKVVTSEQNGTSLARIYVLSKPQTTLQQTADGYKYVIHLRDLAKAQTPVANTPSTAKPSSPPPAVAASRKPQPPTVATTAPVQAARPTAPTSGRKSLVNAVFKNTPLDQALSTLAKQAKVELRLDPTVAGSVNTAFQNVPLDQAVDKLLAVFGPSVSTTYEGQYLVVRRQPSQTPTSTTSTAPPPTAAPPTVSSAAPTTSETGQSSEYFPFKDKDATKMMEAAQKAVPGLRYSVDPLLNILLVEGSPEEIERLNQLIRAMSPK